MHQQIAQVFEARFPALVETQPELVAQHYTAAGCTEPAVVYWQRAGQQGIQRQLETSGDNEVKASQIGGMVMEALKGFDSVAYIRFASVYRDFTEARDFEEFASTIQDVGGLDVGKS